MNEVILLVFLNMLVVDGFVRNFFELKEGGFLIFKNIFLSGVNNNDEVVGNFVVNIGGSKMIVDNCVFIDW